MITHVNTEFHFIAPQQVPDKVDAIVIEQDTFLLLGNYQVIRDSGENYVDLVKKMEQQEPLEPGEVLIKGSNPFRFIAINYNIKSNPVCCDEWIEKSLKIILMECEKRKIISMATPLPGIKYGNISRESAMELFKKIIRDEQPDFPKKIFITNEQ